MRWEVEGFDGREERRFPGIVESEKEDGVFCNTNGGRLIWMVVEGERSRFRAEKQREGNLLCGLRGDRGI